MMKAPSNLSSPTSPDQGSASAMASIFAQDPKFLNPNNSSSSKTELSIEYQAWGPRLDHQSLESDGEREDPGHTMTTLSSKGGTPVQKKAGFSSRELRPSTSVDTLKLSQSSAVPSPIHPELSLPTSRSSALVPQGFNSGAPIKSSVSEDPSNAHRRGTALSLQVLRQNASLATYQSTLSPTSSIGTLKDFINSPTKSSLLSPKSLSPCPRLSPPGLPKSPRSSPARSAVRRRGALTPSSPLQESWKGCERLAQADAQAPATSASHGTHTGHRRTESAHPGSLESILMEGSRKFQPSQRPKGYSVQARRPLERPRSEAELLRQAVGNSLRVSRVLDYGDYEDEEGVIAGFEIPSPSTLLPALVGLNSSERNSGAAASSRKGTGKEIGGTRRHSQGFEMILEDFYRTLPSASEIRPAARNGSFREGDAPKSRLEVKEVEVGSARDAATSAATGAGTQPRKLLLGEYILGIPYENVCKTFLMHRLELGSGQFGTVRKCKEISTGKIFACKSISKKSLKDECDVRDIQREVACLQLLQGQRGFVGMKGVFEDEEYVHIVMDLCRGGDLLDHIVAHGPLAEAQAATMCKMLIESLWKCHKMGIVHRDVKPENILLTKKGSADCGMKLADFGIATFAKKGESLKNVIGTPDYMAPEVYRRCYGAKADVWSAGVVLYAVLSGIPPFWASSSHSLKESILYKDVSFKSTKWEGKSEECKDLITRMLNKDPQKRISPAEILNHPWIRAHAC